ncbi:MAG: LamG domain-containing protein [Candidatus Sericytochromatia bacterium]
MTTLGCFFTCLAGCQSPQPARPLPAKPSPGLSASPISGSPGPSQPLPASSQASPLPAASGSAAAPETAPAPGASVPPPTAPPDITIVPASPVPEPSEPAPAPAGPLGNPAALANVPTDGLVAYYPFDGSVDDLPGQGHHCEVNGAIAYVSDSILGKAARFDEAGENTFILVAGTEALAPTESLTLSAWASFSREPGTELFPIVSKGLDNEDFALWARVSGPELLLNLGSEEQFWGQSENPEEHPLSAAQEWHLYTVTYDSEKVIYYFDGEKIADYGFSQAIQTAGENLYIGMSPAGAVERFSGLLDELRIYDRALSAEEVKLLLLK